MPFPYHRSFLAEIRELRRGCRLFWETPQFLHFTVHGVEHSESIEGRLASLIPRGVLRPAEVFVLGAACHLHDIGMQCRDDAFLKRHAHTRLTTPPSKRTLERIRQRHQELSCAMIRDLASPEPQYRPVWRFSVGYAQFKRHYEIIADISRGHVGDLRSVLAGMATETDGVRCRLLQVLLRLGDALDADASRINYQYYQNEVPWAQVNPIDQFHTLKHFCCARIEVTSARISFTIRVPEAVSTTRERENVALAVVGPVIENLVHGHSTLTENGIPAPEIRVVLQRDRRDMRPDAFPINDHVMEGFDKAGRVIRALLKTNRQQLVLTVDDRDPGRRGGNAKPPKNGAMRKHAELSIENIFAIPDENPSRDTRMLELLQRAVAQAQRGNKCSNLRLLARTGFSYLSPQGPVNRLGLGQLLGLGCRMTVVLENPFSPVSLLRQRVERREDPWAKLRPDVLMKAKQKYKGLSLLFTDFPVYCSLFYIGDSVFYDPYHLGRKRAEYCGNEFLVFEFRRPNVAARKRNRDYYGLLDNYFENVIRGKRPIWQVTRSIKRIKTVPQLEAFLRKSSPGGPDTSEATSSPSGPSSASVSAES